MALLEQTSLVPHEVTELMQYQDETLFPKMDDTRRRGKIVELERSIAARHIEIDRLTPLIGDPETVIDQSGWLPGERREAMLLHYRFERERRVRGATQADTRTDGDRRAQGPLESGGLAA